MKEGQLDILEFSPISRPSLFFRRILDVGVAFSDAQKIASGNFGNVE